MPLLLPPYNIYINIYIERIYINKIYKRPPSFSFILMKTNIHWRKQLKKSKFLHLNISVLCFLNFFKSYECHVFSIRLSSAS